MSDGDGVVNPSEAAAFFEARSRRSQSAKASSEPATASQKNGSAMTEDLNIPYARISGVDPNLLSLDIYRPNSVFEKGPTNRQASCRDDPWRRLEVR